MRSGRPSGVSSCAVDEPISTGRAVAVLPARGAESCRLGLGGTNGEVARDSQGCECDLFEVPLGRAVESYRLGSGGTNGEVARNSEEAHCCGIYNC